eukprot:3783114-Amphidinium_carterae.1
MSNFKTAVVRETFKSSLIGCLGQPPQIATTLATAGCAVGFSDAWSGLPAQTCCCGGSAAQRRSSLEA